MGGDLKQLKERYIYYIEIAKIEKKATNISLSSATFFSYELKLWVLPVNICCPVCPGTISAQRENIIGLLYRSTYVCIACHKKTSQNLVPPSKHLSGVDTYDCHSAQCLIVQSLAHCTLCTTGTSS